MQQRHGLHARPGAGGRPRAARWGRWLSGAALAATVGVGACGDDGFGPDPIPPAFYALDLVEGQSLPFLAWCNLGRCESLAGARLVPYAVGRTVDQRLVNDRTGTNPSGGNTRDTTVARGKMYDVRQYLAGTTVSFDSVLVDVERRDTVFIVSRPHPDPARSQVDTGVIVGTKLVMARRLLRDPASNPLTERRLQFIYEIQR